ncbi:MAG TPA: adenylosuccinate lyase [Gammaproteobacteria bacterium]|nr:adenylosuccinate lyase [Gammaproteobacteria bacterium]
MDLLALTALSPLDGRYQEKIKALQSVFSEYGYIRFRVLVEIRWLQFLAEQGNLPELPKISHESHTFLNNIIENFSEENGLRVKEIEKSTNHDVKAIEYFIKECIEKNSELDPLVEFIHFGCTSEDINNLAYALMLQTGRKHILNSLEQLISLLKNMAHEYANQAMLSRTHGQPATPTTVGKEFANIVARLERQIKQLSDASILGKLNGATGNYNAFAVTYPEINWPEMCGKFISSLGLTQNPYTTQIEPHDYIAEIFAILIRINTILLDFNRDMWGYISLNYFKQKMIDKEVGSSTMPHKINPIDFENAEGNLGLANALLDHMALKLPISRFQRDLSDSTVLRNIGVAIGHALLAYQSTCRGLTRITINAAVINADLNTHWEILGEPIQMVMRRFGIKKPYEQLKNFTRGQAMTKELIQEFIQKLDLPEVAKKKLLALTPENYIGYAEELAKL